MTLRHEAQPRCNWQENRAATIAKHRGFMNSGEAMDPYPERRGKRDRRSSDNHDTLAVRGLLHDLGHEVTTLSYLVESMRAEPGLPAAVGARMELLSLEASRLLDMVFRGLSGDHERRPADIVDVRALASQVAQLAGTRHGPCVTIRPGPDVRVQVSSVLLWRALSNVVGNAARAAGPAGRVELVIGRAPRSAHSSGAIISGAIIEVIDNGPGFGLGPPGKASLGLDVARSLLRSCGGGLEISTPDAGGTQVRLVLPASCDVTGARAESGARSDIRGAGHERG